MDTLEGNFSSDKYLVTRPSESGPSYFDPSTVTSILDKCAFGAYVRVIVDETEEAATVYYLKDEGRLFPSIADPGPFQLYVSKGLVLGPVNLTSGEAHTEAVIVGMSVVPEFPSDWMLGNRSLVESLSGHPGEANFAITDSLTEDQRALLRSEDLSVESMTGVIDFLGLSVDQIQDDILLILLPSAFVIAVLSYGFVGSETADRRHDIGILKTIGAGRSRILGYLFAEALFISLWGGLLGIAFGIILSYGLSTAVSTVFTSVFLMRIELGLLALALLATVAAAAAGALVPALKMTMSSPVSDLREGTR